MKKLIVTFAAIAFATVASADILYWMVDESKYVADQAAYVVVTWTGDAGSNPLNPTPGDPYRIDSRTASQIAAAYEFDAEDAEPFQTNLGSYKGNGYSYYIELANSTRVSDVMTYSALVDAGLISNGGLSVPTGITGATAFGGAGNVPEPTSGLLFVIGGMLLGLKRKRQV